MSESFQKNGSPDARRLSVATMLAGVWAVLFFLSGCGRGGAERKLIFNAGAGNIQIVKVLLERGTNPNTADSMGTTPLMAASANGHFEIVKLLLEKGADSFSRNRNGQTALDMAAAKGFVNIGKILKENQAKKKDGANYSAN